MIRRTRLGSGRTARQQMVGEPARPLLVGPRDGPHPQLAGGAFFARPSTGNQTAPLRLPNGRFRGPCLHLAEAGVRPPHRWSGFFLTLTGQSTIHFWPGNIARNLNVDLSRIGSTSSNNAGCYQVDVARNLPTSRILVILFLSLRRRCTSWAPLFSLPPKALASS